MTNDLPTRLTVDIALVLLVQWTPGRVECGESGVWGEESVGRVECGESGVWGEWSVGRGEERRGEEEWSSEL